MSQAVKPSHSSRKPIKQQRERKVLFGLIELYLRTGKPIGSNTLRDTSFSSLSSATIRNYFAQLEKDGYLLQHHASGGRIPTHQAFRLYAEDHINSKTVSAECFNRCEELRHFETKEITRLLQTTAESLSELTESAVFLSAPRFDQDFIVGIRLIDIDQERCLCVVITDFGVVKTEILYTEKKLSAFTLKRLESYFYWRLTGLNKPENLDPDEEILAQRYYNEIMVRYIVGYSHFVDAEIYRTGFSRLLAHTEFHEMATISNSLMLFENLHSMRLMLQKSEKTAHTHFWIGEDLSSFIEGEPACCVITAPYSINHQSVGAIGLLGPVRMDYPKVFATLGCFTKSLSEALTRNIYKFKISFRQPQRETLPLEYGDKKTLKSAHLKLLEDKSRSQ